VNSRPQSALNGRDQVLETVTEAIRSGDLDRAKRVAREALSQGVEHPLLLNLRALGHEEDGRFDQALTDLRRAHILAPEDFAILNACGLCLARMERLEEALQCYDRVIAIRPDFGPAWFNRGWTLEQLGQRAEAMQCYAKASELNPENAQAWANMAFLAAQRGDVAATQTHADRALAAQPGHPTAELALAQIELADPPVAERRLSRLLALPVLTPFDGALATGLLGDALDAQDRTAEAFAAYAQSNSLFRQETATRFEAPGRSTLPDTLSWMLRWAETLDVDRWRAPAGKTTRERSARSHVFLLGFPRSGTTLVETVLGRHPGVTSLEEKNTLDAGVLAYLTGPKAASSLEAARELDLQPLRDDYWRRVRSFGVNPEATIFIDKNPFNTMKLALIYKLFPTAKIIFALRDPRDVILSCFRRRFRLNPSTYEFLDLKRAAINYDQTMTLNGILKEKQSFEEHTLIYEHLVDDFSGETKAVCDFIGADWRPELIDFAGRAKRGEVASASAAQIARGLYTDGVGQWRRYRDHLEPILGILAPWVERFAYPAD